MTETIFKPGQEYRTRDGRRARVYATDGAGGHPLHGAAMLNDGDWWPTAWSLSGSFDNTVDNGNLDLMPPEPEPQRFLLWGARDATGRDTVLEVEIQLDGTLRAVR